MATTKYFVLPSSTGANFTDFNLSYGSVTLNGEQVAFVGSSAVDAVFVRPGVTVDFTLSGSGADKIYLGGNFASYTASITGSVMTLQRGSGATLESVSFIKSTSAASSDSVIFANGSLNSLDLYNNLKTGTALPALSTAETSVAPLAPAAPGSVLNASIKAFALNSTGDTFAPAHPGVAMTVVGSLGVDTVYVPRGGVVDCTLLGSGQDIIYFTGNWADYNKVISGSVVTFSRTADGYTESVRVVGSATNISLNDRLVFADGAVFSGNAKTTLTASLTAAVSAVPGYDATMTTPSMVVTPGLGPTVASVAISSATGVQSSLLNAGDVVSVTVTMSEATTVTGTPSLALAIGGDTVQATYASGSGTTALVFNYMILAGQTDANGISVAVNSLALNGGTLRNTGNAATLAHAAVADNAGYQVDTTAPTLALTSYSMAENATAVATLAATDTNALTYSLTGAGADNGLFNLTSGGILSFASAPNFEAPVSAVSSNAYSITVNITDAAGNVTNQAVTVNVTNLNDNAPAITSSLLTTSLFEVADAAAGTATAYTLLPGQTAQGYLAGVGDHDWYKVYLTEGVDYSFAMTGSGASDVKNPYLRLYSSTNQSVESNDNSLQGLNAVFTYKPATSDYYYIDAGASTTSAVGEYSVVFSVGLKPSFGASMGAGVIDKDYSWSSHGTSAIVTYGFRQTLPSDYLVSGHDLSTFSQLTSAQQIAVRSNLQFWSDICDITFTEVNAGGYTDNATILIGNYSDVTDGAAGFCIASLTSNVAPSSDEGDVWLNVGNGVSKTTLGLGSNSANTILHELGHSIGLNHPGQYNAEPGKTITYAANSQFLQDSDQYSVMSYFKGTSTQAFSQNPGTPMMFDILAAQNIYGANSATRATDTVYGFNSNAGAAYLFSGSSASTAFCIWDGNGTDTIDVSGFAQNQLINLCTGTFSDTGGLKSNVSIAIGCSIENAKGGSGSDVIVGNALDNIIAGGIGNDMLFGGAGNDTAIFSGTRLNYVVSSITDGWSVVGADGTDRLFNIEYLRFSDQTITLASNSSYVITSYVEADFAENQTGIIYTATATDVDAATTLSYAVGGTDGSKFSINANTGAVTFVNAPDHEAPTDSGGDNLYNLTVYVSDGVNISGAQQIAITVTDVNEAPVITSVATASFAENGTGTAYSATATDPDAGTTLTYALGGTDLGRFNINFNTGALTFKVAPNFEAPTDFGANNVYDITVSASDGSLISTSKAIAITVTNVNEAPVITSVATASFAENGTATAYTATATDPEAGTTFIYALGGTDAGRFNINSSTGAVTFKVAPNYEAPIDAGTNNVYNITVSASDGNLISTSKAVAITVTNVNEAPVITSVATASIAENGTGAVYAVTATDVDAGATRTYAISGADRLVFNINSTTGAVTFKVAPDYEAPTDADADNVYDITVTANDGVNTSAALTVAVSVTNLNDNAPAFTSGGTGTVAENAATNTAIYIAATTDADNLAARTYAVSGTDAGLLDITSAGVVTLKTSADYEAKTSYSFNVIANDGANTVTKAVVVSVTNLNDNTPTMPSAETLSFSENGSDTVFTAYGTDADAGTTLLYSLGGTDSARFNINTTTGAVTFILAPDYEAPTDADANNVYNITVTANDGVNTSAAQTVAVNVTNLNDNRPVFTSGGTGTVAENAATNTVIYAAATTDADNQTCAYTLSGADSTLVDTTSAGVVTLKFSADYETKASYSFNVIANDGPYTLTQAVVVSITNLNDVNFTENGTGIAFTAAVTDMNTAGPLTYALGGADATRFNINATTGAVTFKVAPNYETPTDSGLNNIYDITFTASDGAKTSAAQPVQIVVTDVLELGQPVIDLGAYGKLIAPVQVDGGKWFYYWDLSGDGTSTHATAGTLNGGVDYTSHDFLDGIFNTNINGVINNSVANADGLYGTTDVYRYATINGVHLALPTAGGVTSPPFGANGIDHYQPGTAVGSVDGRNAVNATYDDLLAVWDAYNGTRIGTTTVMPPNWAPVGWADYSYWSATHSFHGHAYVSSLGLVASTFDQSIGRVALQVLPV